MIQRKYQTAIYVGRFSPPTLAHIQTIKDSLELAKQVIVAVGSHNRPETTRTPWSSEERIQMIRESLSAEDNLRISYVPLHDYLYNTYRWLGELCVRVSDLGVSNDATTVIVGHYKEDTSLYLKMFPKWSTHTVPSYHGGVCSTSVRQKFFEKGRETNLIPFLPIPVINFLLDYASTPRYLNMVSEYQYIQEYHAMYAGLKYKPHHVTADAVTLANGCILLIKRKFNPGKGLYAIPGGFVNLDEHIKDAAIRELKEETKIKIPKVILQDKIVKIEVFDHPKRSERGRVITHAHVFHLGDGIPLPEIKAGSDAGGAFWFPVSELTSLENKMFEDHYDILVKLLGSY